MSAELKRERSRVLSLEIERQTKVKEQKEQIEEIMKKKNNKWGRRSKKHGW